MINVTVLDTWMGFDGYYSFIVNGRTSPPVLPQEAQLMLERAVRRARRPATTD